MRWTIRICAHVEYFMLASFAFAAGFTFARPVLYNQPSTGKCGGWMTSRLPVSIGLGVSRIFALGDVFPGAPHVMMIAEQIHSYCAYSDKGKVQYIGLLSARHALVVTEGGVV